MQVIVDGIKDMVSLDGIENETLQNFFDEFKDFIMKNNKLITAIDVDGRIIHLPFVDDVFSQEIKNINLVNIYTVPVDGLSLQTLDEIDAQINKCIDDFKKSSEIIYERKYQEAVDIIAVTVKKWRVCQQALDMITALVIRKNVGLDGAALKKDYKQLQEVVTQLAETIKNNDYMMIKDIIDYELLGKLEEMLNTSKKLRQYL